MQIKNKKIKILTFILSLVIVIPFFAKIPAYADNGTYGEVDAVHEFARSSIPAGAYRINVNINGRRVLEGRVFNLNGLTYVPMRSFADWLGNYTHSMNYASSVATLSGTNLKISARAGDSYIIANDRYFYTGNPILLHNGSIYVPILAMVKALNAHLEWRQSENSFYIRSGDSRLLKNASQVYRSDEVFWLARIISAESRGESLAGKIAVGNVILNRVRSSSYPDTIYGVIFDRKYGTQFSPVSNGTIYQTPTEESVIAAKICLEGYSLSNDILYFVNPKVAPNSWISKNRTYAFTIGNHAFYE